ncbi:hypothetical protein [Synechococcus sp. CBW1006]|uniref:hypothetical protein n=1 Tax=Synechococcus sp. CBW1006 TaxID=1353138 RepID=UPI0018CE20C6|nr:hypothetical protein [Synechococcus sp. CBW1006]QPN66313.1 hypothetical protein H8F26_16245 [Synechococcus sp. CBW1006]
MARKYYEHLSADFSRPGLVSTQLGDQLIEQAEAILAKREQELPSISTEYDADQIEAENMESWPTHCEALRRARGDLLR